MAELTRPDLAYSTYETSRRLGMPVNKPLVADRYRLDERIGAGSFGFVYRARDLVLDRAVAIKTGAPRISDEARALAKLRHPNAVILYDHGIEDDCGYLVLELLSGQTLRQWRQSEPRDTAQIMRVYLEAGRGLAAAHAAGVVHRDFKPDNVIVTRSGRVVVLDFGVATAPGVESENCAGTLPYMAPEQLIASSRVGPSADQFAFCVSLWEAITGSPPFTGDDLHGHLSARIMGPDGPEPSNAIGNILRCGMQPSPSGRWPSMDALLLALEKATRQRRRRPMLLVASAAVAALALGSLPLAPTVGDSLAEIGVAQVDDEPTAMTAAQAGHVDRALSILSHARDRAKSPADLAAVADLADEVGLELYRQGEWLGSEESHAFAHELHRASGREDVATRSLMLAKVARDARHRRQ